MPTIGEQMSLIFKPILFTVAIDKQILEPLKKGQQNFLFSGQVENLHHQQRKSSGYCCCLVF